MTLAVIFDMDGVLVASGPAHAASWRLLARRHGVAMSDETFRSTFGLASRDIVRVVWGAALDDAQVAQLDAEKERLYRELITGMVPLTVGTRETLARLHEAGLRLAVGTSGPRENVELVLRETRLEGYFSAVATGADVARGKPAPDVFLLAAERCGVSPRQCVVVEDAPVGIEAARAAGMATIGLAGTHPGAVLEKAGATRVVTRMQEITEPLIRELANGAAA